MGATTRDIDDLVRLVDESVVGKTSLESGLIVLARRFMSTMMHLRILQLRRLVMANAKRFPDVGRSWCEQGFERVLATLAISFEGLARRKLLRVNDPLLAANHFAGMPLWTPINKAMFTEDHSSSPEELERYAVAAVRTFLAGLWSNEISACTTPVAHKTTARLATDENRDLEHEAE